jgi:hypothetical protein
MEEKQMKSIFL